MSDLLTKVERLEQLQENLVQTQREILTYMKKSHVEVMGQIYELKDMVTAERNDLVEEIQKTRKNQDSNLAIEETLPDEDQTIINQYEVVRTTLGCPINLALDKVEDALLKILSSAKNIGS
ncbi:hypothetical protein GQ457_12G012150 [Hibiscus cannabinus]